MCALILDDLPEHERAEVDKAMAMLDPYLQLTAVDWTANPKESTHD